MLDDFFEVLIGVLVVASFAAVVYSELPYDEPAVEPAIVYDEVPNYGKAIPNPDIQRFNGGM